MSVWFCGESSTPDADRNCSTIYGNKKNDVNAVGHTEPPGKDSSTHRRLADLRPISSVQSTHNVDCLDLTLNLEWSSTTPDQRVTLVGIPFESQVMRPHCSHSGSRLCSLFHSFQMGSSQPSSHRLMEVHGNAGGSSFRSKRRSDGPLVAQVQVMKVHRNCLLALQPW